MIRVVSFILIALLCVARADAKLSGAGPSPTGIVSITPNPPSGTLTAIGTAVTITVCYGNNVTIAGGAPTLPLNTSTAASSATYTSGSGTKCHVYDYALAANAAAAPVATTASGIVPNGAGFIDANGFNANQSGAVKDSFPGLAFSPGLTVPQVTSITSSCAGTIGFTTPLPANCPYIVTFSGPVTVGGSMHPLLNLATSPVPGIAYICDDADAVRTLYTWAQTCGGHGSGSGTNTLYFTHAVVGGQAASPVTTSASAINLNGATIQGTGGAANLAGANSVAITGLNYAPGGAYFIAASGGSDSNNGTSAATPFATMTKVQTAMRGGAVKTGYFLAGTYTGFATCQMQPNNGSTQPAYICMTTADNGQVWMALPGVTAIIDGGSTNSGNGTFVTFAPVGTNGLMVQGLTFQHFNGGASVYESGVSNIQIWDDAFANLFNDGNNGGCGGDCTSTWNGAGGAASTYNNWTNVSIRHLSMNNLTGQGVQFSGGTTSANGFAMTKVVDNNSIINSNTIGSDAGAIYTDWDPFAITVALGPHIGLISDNFVDTAGGFLHNGSNSNTTCYYHDINSSGNDLIGNICRGAENWFLEMDTGSNNIVSNNIIDMTQWAPQPTSQNNTVYYMPGLNVSGGYGCNTSCPKQTNFTINNQIVYNGSASSPVQTDFGQVLGLYSDNPLQIGPTWNGIDWYATAGGSWPGGYPWNAGGITDTSGVTVSASGLFSSSAPAIVSDYQVINAAIISGGWHQIPPTQGPRWSSTVN